MDIYSSPLLVDVDGVESSIRFNSELDKGTSHTKSRTDHDRIRKRNYPPKSPKSRNAARDSGDEVYDPAIPTAVDLAKSFLQTEPREERAELEAAILSETQELGETSVLSEDGDIPMGTGAALSLPSFMARFIEGIVDRLQVRIRWVTMNVDVEVSNEFPTQAAATSSNAVTVQLKVETMDIEGVTHGGGATSLGHEQSTEYPQKKGKRLVCLSKIRAALISDANVFSSLARSSAPSSPSAAHSDMFEDRHTAARHSTRGSTMRTSGSSSSEHNSASRISVASSAKRGSEVQSASNSVIASDSGRFDNAPEDDGRSNMSESAYANPSELGDSVYQNSAYLDHVTQSELLDHSDEDKQDRSLPSSRLLKSSIRSTSPLSTPRASIHGLSRRERDPATSVLSVEDDNTSSMIQSTTLPAKAHSRFSQERVSHSQLFVPLESTLATHDNTTAIAEARNDHAFDNEDEIAEHSGSSSPTAEEDLAQSQLFSHEDAESMYMSAISYRSTPKLPGGWAQSSSDSEETASTANSPVTTKPQNVSLDNLEHALQAAPVKRDVDEITTSSAIQPPPSPDMSTSSSSPDAADKRVPDIPHIPAVTSERSTSSSEEYARVSKQLFDLDQIKIYLPAFNLGGAAEKSGVSSSSMTESVVLDDKPDLSQTMSIDIPGAFSTHLPSERKSAVSGTEREAAPYHTNTNNSVEVDVGKVLLECDFSVGKVVFKLVNIFKNAFEKRTDPPVSTPTAETAIRQFTVNVEDILIHFLERLEGTSSSSNAPPAAQSQGLSPDILLRLNLRGLHVEQKTAKQHTKTLVTLKKLSFGYAQENIVAFDASLHMKASVRDSKAADGIDVSVKITQSAQATQYQIDTLPMRVLIDMQRLDETFSWLGGLSSVLSMGNSIASNATVTAQTPSKPKPRGVRFETPISPDDKSLNLQNKTNIRLGGFNLDLLGTECSIRVGTSAVKAVSRDEGIGVSIQNIRLSSPHLRQSRGEPPITVDIVGTRIEYLACPTDIDLDRLLSLITPSRAKYDQDDDILLDTLLRQRKHGSVVRFTLDEFKVRLGRLQQLSYLPELGEEVSRLSTVTKYLPDDDRPGLLSLLLLHKVDASIDFGSPLGVIQLSLTDLEVAQITFPALVALSITSVFVHRNASEELVSVVTDSDLRDTTAARAPAIMARMIGDEMEPVVKIKLWNLKVEYRVPTLMTILGLSDNASSQDISASLTASVATLTDYARPKPSRGDTAQKPSSSSKSMAIDIVLRDCIIGMNPLSLPSKILLVLTEAHLNAVLPKEEKASASLELNKASILVINDVANLTSSQVSLRPRRHSFDGGSTQVADLCATGYVSVSYISSAKASIQMTTNEDGERAIDVELRDDLFVLESCADSTQTLIAVLNNLSPPTPPSKEIKYRTKVVPVQDLLASLSGDAFGTAEGDYNFDDDFGLTEGLEADFASEDADDLDIDSHYYQNDLDEPYDDDAILDNDEGSVASTRVTSRDTHDGVLLDSFIEQPRENQVELAELDFQEDHFGTGSILEGTAHRWNSAKNTYDRSNAHKIQKSLLKVCVRDVHIIWNLFDGYDWQDTRDAISKAVQEVESKAIEKRARNDRRPTFEQEIEDEETVIGDFLFNSIYIGIPSNRDPRELAAAINQELNDNATETESVATTSLSSSPSRQGSARAPRTKKLRLNRSKHHKITFELRGVSVDLVAFPPDSGETQSSVDIRVLDFEIFDHVPTSTWRKFATYMQDAGERETGTSMIHIEILNVKPVPELAASEIVLKATVLPLRLHVDQDALDFITRFFEFKDDSAPVHTSPSDQPFLQRVEVNSVHVKLDFKPKRVDYAGLRSGHTTEFMNFLILDEADMVLRHTIIYGISGFDKLGQCLNDIWMPDIKRNQLPGILAGLAPVRSLVNVGGGFRHLVEVPIREYKKDGRIVRGISKGAAAFAKTTGTELVKLGAKVAVGVQTVLQSAEDFLGPTGESSTSGMAGDEDDEESKRISLYANQPVGVLQGLRGGYAGLKRDLIVSRDAIIAVPGEAMEGGNAAGLFNAVRKHAPTVILRPAIGVARAGGQILMGATNSLDPVHLQRAEAVSHHVLVWC